MIGLKEGTKAGTGESLKTLYMQKYVKIILHKHGFPSSLPVSPGESPRNPQDSYSKQPKMNYDMRTMHKKSQPR